MSKEDFYRLKKVLQNKRRDENITKVENDAAIVAIAEVEEKDEDVIF